MTATLMLMWAPSIVFHRYSWRPVRAEICRRRRLRKRSPEWDRVQIWARYRIWPLASIRLEDITSTSHVEGSCEIRIEYFNFADASDDACVLLQATDGAEARRFIGELRYAICLAHVHYRNGIRSDLDHAVYEYLCLHDFSAIAQAFMTAIIQTGGSVPVPLSSLYRFWIESMPAPALLSPAPFVSDAAGANPSASVTAATTRPDSAHSKLHSCSWPDCTLSFRKKSNLQRHMLLHEGWRPYRCMLTLPCGSTCNRTFARESALAAHVRVHNGVRPFLCRECGKKFARNSDWRTHVKAVHGRAPYTCLGADCPARFDTLKELRAHVPLCSAADSSDDRHALGTDEDGRDDDDDDAGVAASLPHCQVSTCSYNPPASVSPKPLPCTGHEQPYFQVRHEDHIDFLIDGELHHWIDNYCESHGLFSLADHVSSPAAPSTT